MNFSSASPGDKTSELLNDFNTNHLLSFFPILFVLDANSILTQQQNDQGATMAKSHYKLTVIFGI